MAGELEKRYGADLFRGPGGRQFRRDVAEPHRETGVAHAKLRGLLFFAEEAVKADGELIDFIREHAGDDRMKQEAAVPIYMRFQRKADEVFAGMFNARLGGY